MPPNYEAGGQTITQIQEANVAEGRSLEIGIWKLFGICDLELGIWNPYFFSACSAVNFFDGGRR
jgi:hypothetical protein